MTPERYFVFDTETTGIGPDKQAVDIGIIEIDPVTLEETGRVESLIKPTTEISAEAQAVHGITMEMLKDAPTIQEFVHDVLGGKLEGKVALAGHRIDFDLPLFDGVIGDVMRLPTGDPATIDTLVLAILFCPVQTVNRKLDTLKEALDLPGGGQSHRAMADTMTALQLLRYLLPHTGRDLESLALTEYFTIHEWPWGKHEGKLLIQTPRGYRDFFMADPVKRAGLDRHLRYSLEQVAKADPPPIALPKLRAPWDRGPSAPVRRTIVIPPRRT